MGFDNDPAVMAELKKRCSGKFAATDQIFSHIHRGNKIFIPTGCAEPQYLINSFCDYARSHPKDVLDAEFFYVLTFGAAPHIDEMLESIFRQNTFFVGDSTRHAVNNGLAGYTPIIPGRWQSLPSESMRREKRFDGGCTISMLPSATWSNRSGKSMRTNRRNV